MHRLLLTIGPMLCLFCPAHLAIFGLIGLGYKTHTDHMDSYAIFVGLASLIMFIVLEYKHHRKHKCKYNH